MMEKKLKFRHCILEGPFSFRCDSFSGYVTEDLYEEPFLVVELTGLNHDDLLAYINEWPSVAKKLLMEELKKEH